jgi:hypothetical protein
MVRCLKTKEAPTRKVQRHRFERIKEHPQRVPRYPCNDTDERDNEERELLRGRSKASWLCNMRETTTYDGGTNSNSATQRQLILDRDVDGCDTICEGIYQQ